MKLFCRAENVATARPISYLELLLPILVFVLFPPFVNLCHAVMYVYEESVVYSYLAAIGLVFALVRFIRSPGFAGLALLAFFSGLIMFFRPTFGAYGFSTLVIACLVARTRSGFCSNNQGFYLRLLTR